MPEGHSPQRRGWNITYQPLSLDKKTELRGAVWRLWSSVCVVARSWKRLSHCREFIEFYGRNWRSARIECADQIELSMQIKLNWVCRSNWIECADQIELSVKIKLNWVCRSNWIECADQIELSVQIKLNWVCRSNWMRLATFCHSYIINT